MIQEAELTAKVNKVARRYASWCWWVDLDDLIQEGWVAVLQAQKTWDPEQGISFCGYAGRGIALTMRDYLWRMSAPVTGPSHRGEKLAGLHRASVENLASHLQDDPPDISAEAWWNELTSHMAAVVQEVDSTGAAYRVVMRGEKPEAVAAVYQMPLKDLRATVRLARSRLRTDERLRELALAA